jgi:hypothetical protein
MDDIESSSNFLSALSGFSKTIGQSGIAIFSVGYHLEAFGSWTIESGKRHRRTLLHWDGRDYILSLSRCDVSDSRSAKDWKLAADEHMNGPSTLDVLFRTAENLLLEKV